MREQSRELVAHSQNVREQSEAIIKRASAMTKPFTVLWQLEGVTDQAVRCELDSPGIGLHRLRMLRGREAEPFLVETKSDRLDAIRASIAIYRQLKDHGWKDLSAEGEQG
jgi:hypothetical protein